MTSGPAASRAGAAWLLLALTLAAAAVLVAQPDLRPIATVGAGVVSAGAIMLGVAWHRPKALAWPLLALMIAVWTGSAALVYAQGRITMPAVVLVWVGQAIAAGVTVHAVMTGERQNGRSSTAWLDLVLIATVGLLVGVQIVAAETIAGTNWTTVVVSSVDVALMSMLVRFAVSRRVMGPASLLVLGASFIAIVYDLSSAVQGRRVALPGEPSQILAVVFVLTFAAAALHPSMVDAFGSGTFARHRRPSTALLGLLPLVLVPSGVAWVADASGAANLPPWMVPAAGAVIAGLCLLRGSDALRSSEYLAEHDPLTDLANRRGLARAFDEAPAVGELSLLLIDIDEFKQVNDTHGHDVGDALLVQLRDRLVQATGDSGLAARLGGDEFVVLVPTSQAAGVAERFLRLLEEPAVVEGLVLRTGASVGIAEAAAGMPLAELLTHADVAMYAAKAAGGSRSLHFHPQMRIEVARCFTLSSQIRQLLGHDNPDVGRLEIKYQPLVDLRTGEMVGGEALVRWQHPDHGLLAPDAFLGLVNSNKLDAQLDAAVLHDVLTQLARWRDQGLPILPISVNLTRDSLEDPRLADRVLAALSALGLPTTALRLEITEHDQLSADTPAQHTLAVLDAAGVLIYLDDYGTGYTSLDYLHRFPVHMLKLDRAVVISLDGGQVQLVAAVSAMAAALDLEILAEGIETTEQRDQLLKLGIHYGQGYLFSHPLTAAQYAQVALSTKERTTESAGVPAPRAERTPESLR